MFFISYYNPKRNLIFVMDKQLIEYCHQVFSPISSVLDLGMVHLWYCAIYMNIL